MVTELKGKTNSNKRKSIRVSILRKTLTPTGKFKYNTTPSDRHVLEFQSVVSKSDNLALVSRELKIIILIVTRILPQFPSS